MGASAELRARVALTASAQRAAAAAPPLRPTRSRRTALALVVLIVTVRQRRESAHANRETANVPEDRAAPRLRFAIVSAELTVNVVLIARARRRAADAQLTKVNAVKCVRSVIVNLIHTNSMRVNTCFAACKEGTEYVCSDIEDFLRMERHHEQLVEAVVGTELKCATRDVVYVSHVNNI